MLKEADIVVTNPPFSLFREYVDQLFEYDKKFIIIGNMNAVTYKNIFPRIAANEMWLGPSIRGRDAEFMVPDSYDKTISRVDELGRKYVKVKARWFTNLDFKERYEDIILYERYSPEKFPKYDNYDAINIDKVKEIPMDYDGIMGVPITFLEHYNPNQFEIVAFRKGNDGKDLVYSLTKENGAALDDSKQAVQPYFRVLVRRIATSGSKRG